jgi:hypothetical protein
MAIEETQDVSKASPAGMEKVSEKQIENGFLANEPTEEVEPIVTPKTWLVVFVSIFTFNRMTIKVNSSYSLETDPFYGLWSFFLAHSGTGCYSNPNCYEFGRTGKGWLVYPRLDACYYCQLYDLVCYQVCYSQAPL